MPPPDTLAVAQPSLTPEAPEFMRQFTDSFRAAANPAPSDGGYLTPDGYPLSFGGRTIKPPPWVPVVASGAGSSDARPNLSPNGFGNLGGSAEVAKPEEPAKYISDLYKLVQTDLSNSAVVCGYFLAQIRQVLPGMSPTTDVWFNAVEVAASQAYNKWLTGRSLRPPSSRPFLDQSRFRSGKVPAG